MTVPIGHPMTSAISLYESLCLGIADRSHRARAHPPVGERIGVGPVEQIAFHAPAPIAVDERVRLDAEEPRLEVRAGLELIASAHGLDDSVLHEVFGLG